MTDSIWTLNPTGELQTALSHVASHSRSTTAIRGRQKVDTQWKLYCLVHNIEKLAHHGYGQ